MNTSSGANIVFLSTEEEIQQQDQINPQTSLLFKCRILELEKTKQSVLERTYYIVLSFYRLLLHIIFQSRSNKCTYKHYSIYNATDFIFGKSLIKICIAAITGLLLHSLSLVSLGSNHHYWRTIGDLLSSETPDFHWRPQVFISDPFHRRIKCIYELVVWFICNERTLFSLLIVAAQSSAFIFDKTIIKFFLIYNFVCGFTKFYEKLKFLKTFFCKSEHP